VSRVVLLGMVVLGALFGAGGMLLAERIAPGDLAGADKIRIERVVRDYVLANPELIPQAMQRLQDRENGRAIAASRGAIETPYGNAFIGNPQGDVTLVEFYDYNCGFCRAALPTLDQLVAKDKNLKIVFRELPILAPSSRDAARASLAAAAQGRFKPFHDALYALGPVSTQTIAQAAQRAGVNLAKVPDDAADEIDRNMRTAAKLGVTGTPSWVIGDKVISGMVPYDVLKQAVAAARAAR
jgi:protein-disulfide isomerase